MSSATKIFPSLRAFREAKGAPKAAEAAQQQDPLAHLYGEQGFWFTGGIQDFDPKPLPEVVEIKSKVDAKKLAARGGRPLHLGDPELVVMTLAFYEGKPADQGPPPAIKALGESVAAAKAALAAEAKAEKGKK